MTVVTIPRQRVIAAPRIDVEPVRSTPFLDLLWLVPLTVASYVVALVGGSWIVGVL